MYEYENMAYTSQTGAGQPKPRPDPPVRRYKPFSPTVAPLKDYSTTNLNSDVYLDANRDLSPGPERERSPGNSRQVTPPTRMNGNVTHTPTPTPAPRSRPPQQRSQSAESGPYSPHSYEVQGITGQPRSEQQKPAEYGGRGDYAQPRRPPVQRDNRTRRSPDPIYDTRRTPETRDSNRRIPDTRDSRDMNNTSRDLNASNQSNIKSPNDPNTSRLSYRDRWEQQRAAMVRRSSKEWPKERTMSPDNRSPPRQSQVPEPANNLNHSHQVPEPATLNRSIISNRQEPEPATSTGYNRSILSSSRREPEPNRSILSNPNLSVVISPNQSVIRTPKDGYGQNGSRQRILSGEYRVHDQDRNTSPNRTRPLTPSDTKPASLDTTNGFQDSNSSKDTKTLHRTASVRALREGLLNASRRSLLNLSRLSLLRQTPNRHLTLYGNDWGVVNTLMNLALLAGLSAVLAFMALQMLFRLDSQGMSPMHANSVLTNISYGSVVEVAVALTTFVLMLDLCCLVVCVMQCFFASKLLKCPQGEERAFKYLKECSGTRFIAITGFFMSVPAFLMTILLYILMEFRATSAIISTVVMTVGFTFSLIVIIHSTYFWRIEKNRADMNIPPYDMPGTVKKQGETTMSEFSTLV